jgi:hypothetical protein
VNCLFKHRHGLHIKERFFYSFTFTHLFLIRLPGHLLSFVFSFIKLITLCTSGDCEPFLFGMSDKEEADVETENLMNGLKGLVIGASGNIPGYQHRQ